jgi:hypothetical protein
MPELCECACDEYCSRGFACDDDCACFPCPVCHPLYFEDDDG